jgi:hypothetical protein
MPPRDIARLVAAIRTAQRRSMKCPGELVMAKQQNTYEKRRREVEKKRKAESKLERRRQKKLPLVQPPMIPVSPPEETPA